MASNGALPQTLKSITATKIKELSKQRALFDARKTEILAAANAAPDLRVRAQTLLSGLSRMNGFPKDVVDQDDMDLDVDSSSDDCNDPDVARLSRYDASISETALRGWITQLEDELRYLELKHQHASFYSNLVTEWLSHLEEQTASSPTTATDSTNSDKSFESVGRAEMHEQRAQWESLVFTSVTNVSELAIRSYLDALFASTKLSQQALKVLRESLQKFGTELANRRGWLDVEELEWVSHALLKTDLLSNEKMSILKEFMRNSEVMQEVADVLNMRLASLDTWAWGEEGIPIDMRRQLNGKYRVYMDEDLLDSLLLQYLGTTWAVELRGVFQTFMRSHAWKELHEDIPAEHKRKRKHFLGAEAQPTLLNVNDLRSKTYKRQYFMSQLPESVSEGARKYDDDGHQAKNALETKHSLLHLLVTESLIHKAQRGEFTAIRSDFQWFGPSMPHTTLLTVMDYFGVPQMWLNFFKVFLEAPLRFIQDGPDAPIQFRRRGLPISHTLSDCFGESVLFCMDYAVNQGTNGAILYRLHDDFWFWGSEETCVKAWESMIKFAKVMGLAFNQEKTGTVRMKTGPVKTSRDSGLPAGDIRWGFLILDAKQGRFIINQAQVDKHIEELSRQLSSCKSVFAWVQAWNSYFGRFFTNNFARPAMCFGREHIDMAISTLSRIEQTLFNKTPTHGSGVTNYLRAVIATRFDIHSLPEGFFYYPAELGGLGLLNPYIRLLSMRENIKLTPKRRLHKASVQDEMRYQSAKDKYQKDGSESGGIWSNLQKDRETKSQAFMSLEDFTKYPETYSAALRNAYEDLVDVPGEMSVECTAAFTKSQAGLGGATGDISARWRNMSPYWRGVAELYHDEMVRTYGSLAAVNREFMPLGVVKTLREGRFRWQG